MLLKDKDPYVRGTAAYALGRCSKKLKEDELGELVKRLHAEGHNEAVEEIKKVWGRRFIRILHP